MTNSVPLIVGFPILIGGALAVMLKVSLTDPPASVAVTFTATVPASVLAGVPANARVAGVNRSQPGSAVPSGFDAV